MQRKSMGEDTKGIMDNHEIKSCSVECRDRYGEIYAKAFLGEPWNDSWKKNGRKLEYGV